MNNGYMQEIKDRIDNCKEGTVFVASDFSDIADSATLRQSLKRLSESGDIRRIIRGLYEKPVFSKLLNEYVPADPNKVAYAMARNYNWTIAPCGDASLNLLGLSSQVVSNWSYISDGPYKVYEWGNTKLEFKHRTNKEITGVSYTTSLIIQSLKQLGCL